MINPLKSIIMDEIINVIITFTLIYIGSWSFGASCMISILELKLYPHTESVVKVKAIYTEKIPVSVIITIPAVSPHRAAY